jgi:hypothetical protein
LNDFQKVLLGLLLPFSIHSSWSDVFQVLQPFEITDSDTTGITQNIWQELNAFISQDLFSFQSGWTVGSFNDKFGLEFVSIVFVDSFFQSSGNKEVNRFVDGGIIQEGFTAWISLDCFVFVSFLVLEEFIRVDSVWIEDTSVPFGNTDEFGSSLYEKFGSPVPDVTETLNAESLSDQSFLDAQNFAHF